MAPIRVPLVCIDNSAHSQMAAGFARVYGAGSVGAFSAGLEPKGLNPLAVEVMQGKSSGLSQQESKAFSEDPVRRMGYVITVCGHADERRLILPPEVKRLHWPLEDPAQAQGSAAAIRELFLDAREGIDCRVRALLTELGIPHA
jgi:arsenate reductase (thioredoxin)